MSAYIAKAPYAAGIIDKLNTQYPGIKHDPLLYNLVYSGLRAMPRVQGVVKRNYIGEIIRLTKANVRANPIKRESFRDGEEYDDIEIVAVTLKDFIQPKQDQPTYPTDQENE